jgi:sugar lactone lactonase YvrE
MRAGRGIALLALLAAVGSGCTPKSPPAKGAVDTVAVAGIATHLERAFRIASADSGAFVSEHLAAARALNPKSDELTFLAGFGAAQQGDTAGAIRWLDSLRVMGSCLTPEPGRAYARVEQDPGVQAALARLRAAAEPRHRATVAFSLAVVELFPEGIGFDPVGRTFYLSSLRHRKVVSIAWGAAGAATATDYLTVTDSLWSTLGIKIDSVRRRLWVATAAEGFAEGERPEEAGRSAVVVADLVTGQRLRRVVLPRVPSLANDLALDSDGNAYLTDTDGGALYRIGADSSVAETLFPPGTFASPNGIAVVSGGRVLLVADGRNGIWRVEVASRSRKRIAQASGPMPLFLDGLAIHGSSVVAVTHTFSRGRVLRFRMSPQWDAILRTEVLECNHPLHRLPTTGVVVGDTLFYIATSQFDRLRPYRDTGLVATTVLALPLGPP